MLGQPVIEPTVAEQTVLPPGIIAVSISDAQKFGCPHCGGIYGNSPISGGGSQAWKCADCGTTSIYVSDDLQRSTLGVDGEYPMVQPHPRRDRPIDREQIIAEHDLQIELQAFAALQRWLSLGHAEPMVCKKVGSHSSKSCGLPIIASDGGSNVNVTWFGYNYYFHFLGVQLHKPVPATLLYPISGMFGSYALSGHVNREVAPPITNFQKLYHNCTPVQKFGGDCGSEGVSAALALRYLEEVSKLDIDGILDVCLRQTNYGPTDVIDGNGIEFDVLLKLLGIEGGELYKRKITNAPSDIFEELEMDWFGTYCGGKSAVRVKMQEGVYMPPLPSLAEVSLNSKDTILNQYGVSEKEIERVPLQRLCYRTDDTAARYAIYNDSAPYQPHQLYGKANIGTREFALHTPNVLDSALTAFFLIKVLAPVLRAVQKS